MDSNCSPHIIRQTINVSSIGRRLDTKLHEQMKICVNSMLCLMARPQIHLPNVKTCLDVVNTYNGYVSEIHLGPEGEQTPSEDCSPLSQYPLKCLLSYHMDTNHISGIASFFLGDGYLGRRRAGVVAQEQPPFYIGHLLKQPALGVNRRLKRVQYRAKHGQQPVYSCAPVNAACAVWILACLVVGEDLPESVLRCQDLLRHIHGQIESCDFCPSETPAGSCGQKRHLGASNRA